MMEKVIEVKKNLLNKMNEEINKITNPQDFYVYSVVLNMLELRKEYDPSESYTKMVDGLLKIYEKEKKDDNVSKVD